MSAWSWLTASDTHIAVALFILAAACCVFGVIGWLLYEAQPPATMRRVPPGCPIGCDCTDCLAAVALVIARAQAAAREAWAKHEDVRTVRPVAARGPYTAELIARNAARSLDTEWDALNALNGDGA